MNGDHHRMCLLNKNLGIEVFFDLLNNCSLLIVEKYCVWLLGPEFHCGFLRHVRSEEKAWDGKHWRSPVAEIMVVGWKKSVGRAFL